jgi:adenine deaminase
MIRKALFILCLLSTVKLPTATAATKHLILIKATRLLDTRTGTVLSDQEILIEGDKIAQVGSPSVIGRQAPGSIKVIDLTGLTVLPGHPATACNLPLPDSQLES